MTLTKLVWLRLQTLMHNWAAIKVDTKFMSDLKLWEIINFMRVFECVESIWFWLENDAVECEMKWEIWSTLRIIDFIAINTVHRKWESIVSITSSRAWRPTRALSTTSSNFDSEFLQMFFSSLNGTLKQVRPFRLHMSDDWASKFCMLEVDYIQRWSQMKFGRNLEKMKIWIWSRFCRSRVHFSLQLITLMKIVSISSSSKKLTCFLHEYWT